MSKKTTKSRILAVILGICMVPSVVALTSNEPALAKRDKETKHETKHEENPKDTKQEREAKEREKGQKYGREGKKEHERGGRRHR